MSLLRAPLGGGSFGETRHIGTGVRLCGEEDGVHSEYSVGDQTQYLKVGREVGIEILESGYSRSVWRQ